VPISKADFMAGKVKGRIGKVNGVMRDKGNPPMVLFLLSAGGKGSLGVGCLSTHGNLHQA
jgi:hypothetical protein